MGLLDRFKRGGKDLSDLEKNVVSVSIAGESQRSANEHEDAQLLGINLQMIRDEGALKFLEKLAEQGEGGMDYNALALRVEGSPVMRTSFVDEDDAYINMLKTKRMINRMEMALNEDAYEFGGTNLLEAYCDYINTGISDSIRGRKALLMKVSERRLEVSVPEKKAPPQSEKRGGLFG